MQTIQIKGITCEACIKLIKRKFEKLPTITDVIAKDMSGKMQIVSSEIYTKETLQESLAGTDFTVISVT
ncbi:MAG: hypothetical protein US98_C0014G0006 [Parcubacteria group bacterium GW2011_GWC1_38_6]|nr:MAG: hypothetical protein US98_C0014G0006 [Parcubacteria group bacterium GW2011_GWC1_38_6]